MESIASGKRPTVQAEASLEDALEDLVEEYVLLIDVEAHRAFYRERELDLSDQLFGLLVFLARGAIGSPGWLPRASIEEELWSDEAIAPRRLDNAMARLKKVLAKAQAGKPPIEMKVRVGLRLRVAPEDICIR